MAPTHQHTKFANKELLWYPYDDLETYKKNLESRREDLKRLGWIDKKITYKFNNFGHRSDEFQKDSVVFLGCSITFGIGLPFESIFPNIVSNNLFLPCINLSVSGSSNDTAFRLSDYWLPRLDPKIVILMSPDKSRLELIDQEVINFRINAKSCSNLFYQRWVSNDENSRLNQLKNIYGIELLCRKLNIKFLYFTVENDFCFIEHDLARDLSHPGIKSHLATADKILSKI